MGWIFVNIMLPIFAPLAVLPLFQIFKYALPEKAQRLLHWTTPIKDGQLAWIALAFNGGTGYELFASHESSTVVGGGLLGLAGLAIADVVLASLGGVFPVEARPPAGTSPWRHYVPMSVSAVFTLLSAIAFVAVHFLA
jgi:hypothetical protein